MSYLRLCVHYKFRDSELMWLTATNAAFVYMTGRVNNSRACYYARSQWPI